MRVSVTVDDREPAGVVATVRDHPDVTAVRVERLPAADIVIGEIGIERKTFRDYINSVMGAGGTDLYDQVRRMNETYYRSYVLLEGDLHNIEDLPTDVGSAAVHGSMASLAARHDSPVIPCSDCDRLVDIAVRLGRKHVEEPSSRPLPPGTVTGRSVPTTRRIYGCIEGIGPETAATLHERYPTVESLVAATVDDLMNVDGIGEKRATAIYESLRGEA